MEGRVVAGHTTAMGSYNDAYAFKLLQILKRAGVTIVANPLDNIVLQGRFDTYPKRRGMTRVKELDAAGVNVACGHDSIMDPWYPLGRGSMLDALSMLVHVAQMTGRTELFRAYEMVTTNPARAAGVAWGVKEGLAGELRRLRLRGRGRGDPAPTGGPLGRPQRPGRGRDRAGTERGPRRRAPPGPSRSSTPRVPTDHRSPDRSRRAWRTGKEPESHMATELLPLEGMPTREGDLSIEGARHGADPRVGPLRIGQPALHRLVHARTSSRRRSSSGRSPRRFIGLGSWTGVARDHRRQRDRRRPRRRSCRRWARGPAWPRSRPPGCRSARRSSCPGSLNWLSTIGWDAINAFFGALRDRRHHRRRRPVPGSACSS